MNQSKLIICISLLFLLCTSTSCIKRITHALHLFDEDKIVENFRTLYEVYPSSTMNASEQPFQYHQGKSIELPKEFTLNNEVVSTDFFLEGSKTTGFIVIQEDSIVYENYFLGNTAATQNISWSVAKSFIVTLFGIAVDEGYIKSLDETVDTYLPELIGSGYEGVRIEEVLEMSSGIEFNEDYESFNSDINRWGRAFAMGKSQDKFAMKLKRACQPGTYHHYVSIDTHILGMLLKRVTGETITAYMQEKLWSPLGMEHEGYWGLDNSGMEVVLCGLNATLRDYAKLGSLYLNKGKFNGVQIVSEEWISASTHSDKPHLQPGNNPMSAHELGYGYQWWIPEGKQGEYLAQGVYNQTIYVNPSTKTVIVKLSANDKFNDESYIPSQWQATIAFYRAITAELTK